MCRFFIKLQKPYFEPILDLFGPKKPKNRFFQKIQLSLFKLDDTTCKRHEKISKFLPPVPETNSGQTDKQTS